MTATRFLDLTRLREVTAEVRLPPGWSVTVYQDEFLGPHARFTGTLPDSYHEGATTDLGVNARIPPCREVRDYLDWLHHRWVEIWVHEARETFWFNGVLWSDPHATSLSSSAISQ